MSPKTLPSPSAHKRTQLPFDIGSWLKRPGMLVTRGELWEFINRLEIGKRVRNRWDRRLQRGARRLWGWLLRRPTDAEDPHYR